MAKRGPKHKFAVTEDILKEVKLLAGVGLTQQQIHQYYGLQHTAWHGYTKRHPELYQAIENGKAKNIAFVAGKLMDAIRKGNVSAMIFYLKTQARWSDHSTLEVKGDDKGPLPALSLTVNDPVEASKIYQKIMLGS